MYHRHTMKQIPVYTPVDVVTSGSPIHNVRPTTSYHKPVKPKKRVALAAWEELLAEIAAKS